MEVHTREARANSIEALLPESIAGIQKNSFAFTWFTEEYCGDDGSLRARGK